MSTVILKSRMDIELQVILEGWQHVLQASDYFRVWAVGDSTGPLLEISLPLMVKVIGHYMSQARLMAELLVPPATPPVDHPPPRRSLPAAPPRRPAVFDPEIRATLRARRRKRSSPRKGPPP